MREDMTLEYVRNKHKAAVLRRTRNSKEAQAKIQIVPDIQTWIVCIRTTQLPAMSFAYLLRSAVSLHSPL